MDSHSLYRLHEERIMSLHYDRDADGIPRGWVQVMDGAIRTGVADWSRRLMVEAYTEQFAVPAMRA